MVTISGAMNAQNVNQQKTITPQALQSQFKKPEIKEVVDRKRFAKWFENAQKWWFRWDAYAFAKQLDSEWYEVEWLKEWDKLEMTRKAEAKRALDLKKLAEEKRSVEDKKKLEEENSVHDMVMKSQFDFAKNVIWATADSTKWLADLALKWVSNLAEEVAIRTGNEDLAKRMDDAEKKTIEETGDVWQNKDSALYKWTKFVADVSQVASPAISSSFDDVAKYLANNADELATKLWISKLAVTRMAKKAWEYVAKSPTASAVVKWAYEWAKDTVLYDAVANSEVATPTEVLAWGVIGGWIPLVWKGIDMAKKTLKPLANKLQLSGLLNPKKLEYISNTLRETGDDVDDVANRMFERNIKWSKNTIVNQLEESAKNTRSAVVEWVKSIQWKYKNDSVWNALDELKNALEWSKSSLQKSKYDEITSLIKKHTDEWLDLADVQKVKENMDEVLSIYTVAWDVKASQKNMDLHWLRADIRWLIEKEWEKVWLNFKKLNRDTAVAKQLSKSINYKDKADYIRDALSPFASPFAGWLLWFASGGGTPEERLKNTLIWWAVGAWIWSTLLKTKVASVLAKMSSKEKSFLLDKIQKWAMDLLPISYYEKLAPVFSSDEDDEDQ